MERATKYSPHLRTALVLTGTGTAGAYHAGVLRALHEAGVKIDIVAGRGIGVIGALFMAVDGGARLWEPQGLWRSDGATRLYRWRATLRAAVWTLGAALASLLLPLAVLVGAIVAYPVSFLLQVVGVDAGERVASGYARLVAAIFDPAALPALLPRAILFLLGLLLVILTAGAARAMLRTRARRRARGALWWRLLGTPLDVTRVVEWFTDGLWQIMRGAARIAKPAPDDLGARFAELLADNVGQPGFRELVVLTHDVDARRDLVFALLSEPHRRGFFLRRVGGEDGRHLETVDLAAAARRHAVDALSSALSLPVVTQPHLVTFTPDGPWRGETHRVCDRPDGVARLLEEVARAGAEQVVLVSALTDPPGPHTLSAGRRDARGLAGEYLVAVETAALRDAVGIRDALFQAIFEIRPSHNPLGPFDFGGCYDERSDRRQSLTELVDRGYEDGFRQFVDSVVGASGESIERPPGPARRVDGPLREEVPT